MHLNQHVYQSLSRETKVLIIVTSGSSDFPICEYMNRCHHQVLGFLNQSQILRLDALFATIGALINFILQR